jgi:hypothetical protein
VCVGDQTAECTRGRGPRGRVVGCGAGMLDGGQNAKANRGAAERSRPTRYVAIVERAYIDISHHMLDILSERQVQARTR